METQVTADVGGLENKPFNKTKGTPHWVLLAINKSTGDKVLEIHINHTSKTCYVHVTLWTEHNVYWGYGKSNSGSLFMMTEAIQNALDYMNIRVTRNGNPYDLSRAGLYGVERAVYAICKSMGHEVLVTDVNLIN